MNEHSQGEGPDTTSRLNSALPIVEWLREYQNDWLRPHVIAGLTAAAVVIPKAMAYATIAGLPVQVGLYTAFLPMIVYAVLGTSRALSVSTTTTLAILVAAERGVAVPNGDKASLLSASAILTVLVGAILVLAALLRLGFVANFISDPVLIGYKAGIGLVIVVDQIPKLLGLHLPKGSFVQHLLGIFRRLSETSATTIERLFQRIPAPLIAVAVGIAGAAFLGLSPTE